MSYNKETGMYEGYIYKIVNDVNDKVYIGQTMATTNIRFSQHIFDSKHKTHKSMLYNAMNKYGHKNFHILELEKIISTTKSELKEKLNELEIHYIELYKSTNNSYGYNISLGGSSSNYCYKKISQYDMDGNLIKVWDSMTDIADHYDVTKSSISACCRGKAKSCMNYVWRYYNDSFDKYENIQKIKVINYDLNGNILGIYDSISDAARIVYGDVSHVGAIVANCRGKYNKCKGTVWRYEFDSFDKYSLENKSKYRKTKKVNCYTMEGIFIKTYNSVKEATHELNLKSISSVQESCVNHKKHARNMLWYYSDDPKQPDKTKIIA